jgi:hypothetical protein
MHSYFGYSPERVLNLHSSHGELQKWLGWEPCQKLHQQILAASPSRSNLEIKIDEILRPQLPDLDASVFRSLVSRVSEFQHSRSNPQDAELYFDLEFFVKEIGQRVSLKRRGTLWALAVVRQIITNPKSAANMREYLRRMTVDRRFDKEAAPQEMVDVFQGNTPPVADPPYFVLPFDLDSYEQKLLVAEILLQKMREAMASEQYKALRLRLNRSRAHEISELVLRPLDRSIRKAYSSTSITSSPLSILQEGLVTVEGAPYGIPFTGTLEDLRSAHAPDSRFGVNLARWASENGFRIWLLGDKAVGHALGMKATEPRPDMVVLDDKNIAYAIESKESRPGRHGGSAGAHADTEHAEAQTRSLHSHLRKRNIPFGSPKLGLTLESRLGRGLEEVFDESSQRFLLYHSGSPKEVDGRPLEIIRVSDS